MLRQLLVLIAVGLMLALFFYKGVPALQDVKEARLDETESAEEPSENVSVERRITVDISIESICQNLMTGDIYAKCQKSGCDATCRMKAAVSLG